MILKDERLRAEADAHPYPLLFATVSGAHLYGFPSENSDWDVRGCHLLPLSAVAGLEAGEDTVKRASLRGDAEVDLVTHDARKFLALLLRDNGYVLEQLYSPLVVLTTPEHEELKAVARGCITRRCARHYLGFAHNQWRLWAGEEPRRVKPLLYVYRVLLTGIRLMRSGEVLASLPACNVEMGLPYIDELIERKTAGPEHALLDGADASFHASEYVRLSRLLADAAASSRLPESASPGTRAALHDLLLRVRMGEMAGVGLACVG
ncbi:MAG TPA: nucleotidyltransferase domain-containing protein [Longimicrobium sp.]|nr:nucleotidyltransferase domain-containing protein [Longimicrobium sp.]